MTRSLRTLVLSALAVGVAGGAGVALATQSREPEPPPSRPDGVVVVRAKAPTQPPPVSVDRLALAVEEDSMALEQRVADPRGGPDWAVRTFVADVRQAGFGDRTLAETEVVGRNRCVQLGRIVEDEFGWVDAQRRFRAVAPGWGGSMIQRGTGGGPGDAAPVRCRPTDARPEAVALLETLVDDPTDGETEPIATVAWGLAADSETDRVALRRLSDRERSLRLDGRRGAFVAPAGADVRAHEVTARFDGGEPVRLGRLPGSGGWPGTPDLRRGTSRLEVRAPDPSGGPALGAITARREDGAWCVSQPAQVVGERIGWVNLRLGIFSEANPPNYVCPGDRLTPQQPIEASTGFGAGSDVINGTPPPFGRVALRTLPGTLTISGLTHPDVRLVTIATERGDRTLAPSARSGAFVAVFDGDFPAAPIELIATMADGSTVTQSLEMGF
ncbi:MAG: hypothetical protein MSC31_18195 [Solirubrobacteraceae bacterium MAG38_C4-C5]|nr:hypothetical protein [Candidatus Siliceabacter maunaloa]